MADGDEGVDFLFAGFPEAFFCGAGFILACGEECVVAAVGCVPVADGVAFGDEFVVDETVADFGVLVTDEYVAEESAVFVDCFHVFVEVDGFFEEECAEVVGCFFAVAMVAFGCVDAEEPDGVFVVYLYGVAVDYFGDRVVFVIEVASVAGG